MTVPPDLARALDDLAAALAAMGAGDPAPYAALWADSADATLFGASGPIERGHHSVTTTFTWFGSRFSGGALVPRHEVVGHSGDLAYTVAFEHKTVDTPEGGQATYTLRTTHVFRREGGEWRIVHRHGDLPPGRGDFPIPPASGTA